MPEDFHFTDIRMSAERTGSSATETPAEAHRILPTSMQSPTNGKLPIGSMTKSTISRSAKTSRSRRQEWEAPDWVYDEVDHFTVSEDFKVPTATAGQKEDGTFYADFENEECLISVGYNLKSFDANNSVWLDLGYSFNVNYDEADGMATMAFDGKWVGLNGEPVNLDLANETNESVSFNANETNESVSFNIPIVLKYSDSSTQETRIREQFQYARNENNEIVSTALSDGRWITLGYWFRYENGQGIPSRAQYPVYSLAGNTAQVAYPVYEADFTLGYDVDVEMIDLPAGQYMVTFTFTDIFGNKNLQTEPIIFNLVD